MKKIFILLVAALTSGAYGQDNRQAAENTIKQYCSTCHSAALRTAGVVLDPSALGKDPELWEKAVHQLRAKSMPPPSMPRPDAATYNKTASYLEAELDRTAAAKPNAGSLPSLHRLTRTE